MIRPSAAVCRRRSLPLALTASGALLAGCSQDPNSVAAQAKSGDQKGYVSGDGTVEQIPAADRGAPVDLSGNLLGGGTWSSTDHRGSVVVINVWGSWCPPCVAEIGDLQAAWDEVQAAKKDVQFIGIDFREDAARGEAFPGQPQGHLPEPDRRVRRPHPRAPGQGADDRRRPSSSTPRAGSPPGSAARSTTSTLTGLIDDTIAGT